MGRDQHRGRAHILADLRQRMCVRADQIHNSFDGCIDEFGSEHQRGGQHDHRPIARRQAEPKANDQYDGRDGTVDPDVALSL